MHLHQIGRLEKLNDTFMQLLHVVGHSFCFLDSSTSEDVINVVIYFFLCRVCVCVIATRFSGFATHGTESDMI